MKTLLLTILTMTLVACGGSGSNNQPGNGNSPKLNPDYSDLQPYIASSPYADTIVRCVAIENDNDSCTLNELPPIGLDNNDPSIDDVLNHLVVSHTWMGDRMRDLLEIMPADMLLLLRSNTAIVIDDDIRPAHFRRATGAIYIDPAFLWLNNTEKATINPKEDFRSNFGNDLQFKRIWRYLIDNQYAWQNYALDGTEERTISDTLVSTTWLFYHELAHANDCLPPNQISNLNRSSSYYSNYLSIVNSGQCVQDSLTSLYPLSSGVWFGLAGVLYQGDNSTASQRAMSPDYVGAEFENDYANDTYSYSSVWEDTAMTFEAILMKRNFNADRDMAIVPFYEEFDCDTALVKWGQRGRLGEPSIIARAEVVLEGMLPEIDFSDFLLSQPLPVTIPYDTSYCSLDLSAQKIGVRQVSSQTVREHLENQPDIK